MVCKKCGRSFNDGINTCPFCGVGQENQIDIKKLENELENLKIEDNTSSFYSDEKTILNSPKLDVEDIIEDLEDLKIKEKKIDNTPVPRAELVSDEALEELISDIKENKELFVPDKSQYQYNQREEFKFEDTNKDTEIIDISSEIRNNENIDIIDVTSKTKNIDNENIGLNDLLNKQKLYNPEEIKKEKQEEIELPESLNIYPIEKEDKLFNIDYSKKKKNYTKEIVFSIIVLIVVGTIAVSLIYKFMFSSKANFLKNLTFSYNEIKNITNKYTENFNELLKYDDVSLSSTSTINTVENEYSNREIVNIKYIENKLDKSKYYEYTNFNSLKTQYKKMFITNNKLYVNKEDKTDEFYITDTKFTSILNNKNKENTEYLVDILIDSIKKNISNEDFNIKKTKEELKEITLTIDEKLYSGIYSSFLKNIRYDNKAIEIILNNYNFSQVELMTKIDNKIKELESKKSNKIVLTYKYYIDKNKNIVKHLINYDKMNILLLTKEKEIELKISDNKEEKLYLKLKNIEDNRYSINMNYDNYELLGDYYEQNSKIILNFQKIYNNDESQKEIVNLVLTRGDKKLKEYTNNISIAYQKTDGNRVISKNIDTSNIIEVNKKIPEIDITDSNKIQIMDDNLKNQLKENFSIFIK